MPFNLKVGQFTLWPIPDAQRKDDGPQARGEAICPHCKTRLRLSAWSRVYNGTRWMLGQIEVSKSEKEGK